MESLPKVSKLPTVRRLPAYLHLLRDIHGQGVREVSATLIAARLKLEPIQVRKDLAMTGVVGKPRIGFHVAESITAIEAYLGWNNTNEAVLVGAGSLGTALLGYGGFEKHQLKIVAAFDIDPARTGREVHETPVFPLEKLDNLARRLKIRIGIITVPADAAQAVADLFVAARLTAIWNFTPVTLNVPPGVIVQNEDLSTGLAVLSRRLRDAEQARKIDTPPGVLG